MSHHQQMLKCSAAAFTYLHIFYHYSMAQSPEIFSAFLPWTFCTPDEPFFKPLKYPDNETEIKQTSGALWPHRRQTLLPTRAWDVAGSSPCSFAGARGAAHWKHSPSPLHQGHSCSKHPLASVGGYSPVIPGVALRGRSCCVTWAGHQWDSSRMILELGNRGKLCSWNYFLLVIWK